MGARRTSSRAVCFRRTEHGARVKQAYMIFVWFSVFHVILSIRFTVYSLDNNLIALRVCNTVCPREFFFRFSRGSLLAQFCSAHEFSAFGFIATRPLICNSMVLRIFLSLFLLAQVTFFLVWTFSSRIFALIKFYQFQTFFQKILITT